MTEEEKKFKNRWVTILFSFALFNLISTIISQIYFNPPMDLLPAAARYLSLATCLFITLGFSYLLYRCSCKKPGTKLLTFSLIMTAISMAFLPVYALLRPGIFPFHLPYYKAFIALTQIICVLWVGLCWKMRKINKKLRAQPQG